MGVQTKAKKLTNAESVFSLSSRYAPPLPLIFKKKIENILLQKCLCDLQRALTLFLGIRTFISMNKFKELEYNNVNLKSACVFIKDLQLNLL